MAGPSGETATPVRVLLGPGPSSVHPQVTAALAAPVLGHLDPAFIKVMDDTMALLRQVFQTHNALTFPLSGTGSAGMEAALCNALEPGDTIVVGVNGYFGARMMEMAARCGARPVPVKAEWGRIIAPEAIESALRRQARVKAIAVVHAETSTGVLQPLEEIGRLAQEHGALLIVDAVTSLGGHAVAVDDWGIDICYSGTQKCLGAPPGLAPITFGDRAQEALGKRQSKVQSWYLDVTLLRDYWMGSPRAYHHTASSPLVLALREALRMVLEEGLAAQFKRHLTNGAALQGGLEAMGLKLFAQEGHRLSVLTAVRVPEGIDELRVRQALLNEEGIEIGGGLGELRGKIWRIGLMGYSSSKRNALLVLSALERALARQGFELSPGIGLETAEKVWKMMEAR